MGPKGSRIKKFESWILSRMALAGHAVLLQDSDKGNRTVSLSSRLEKVYIIRWLRRMPALSPHRRGELYKPPPSQREWHSRAQRGKIRLCRHDMHFTLYTPASMLERGNTAGALQYLGESDVKLGSTALTHYCKSPMVDALLAYYEEQVPFCLLTEPHTFLPASSIMDGGFFKPFIH